MRVLYHFRTRGTGAEGVHIAGVAEALEELGHQVEFESPTGIDPRQSAGDDPFKGKGRRGFWAAVSKYCPRFLFEFLEIGYNFFAYCRNRKRMKRSRPDFIYERHAYFLCGVAHLAKRHNIPLIVEVNELVGDARIRKQPFLSPIARWTDRFCFRRATAIIVVSPHLKRRIVELGVPEEKVLVLPNAVKRREYETPADASAVRERYDFAGKTVIGFVGWLVAWHNLEAFVRAFATLAKSRDDLRLLLIGDGPLRSELEEIAAGEGVGDRMVITGAVPHSEVPAHIAAMDIAVIPESNAYRSPIKLFEYMGQAAAVLAPDTEPIQMVIRDGENGILFPNGNPEAMQAGLECLLADGSMRRNLGETARRDVLEKHVWTENVRRVIEVLPPGIQ